MPKGQHVGTGVEFVGSIPGPGHRRGGMSWANHLQPLVARPGVWALIETCDTPSAANKIQSNLHQRQLVIPFPDHLWEFAARGVEVFGVYKGNRPETRRTKSGSVRRAYRRR